MKCTKTERGLCIVYAILIVIFCMMIWGCSTPPPTPYYHPHSYSTGVPVAAQQASLQFRQMASQEIADYREPECRDSITDSMIRMQLLENLNQRPQVIPVQSYPYNPYYIRGQPPYDNY